VYRAAEIFAWVERLRRVFASSIRFEYSLRVFASSIYVEREKLGAADCFDTRPGDGPPMPPTAPPPPINPCQSAISPCGFDRVCPAFLSAERFCELASVVGRNGDSREAED
jgi:hypothetical protein